MQQSRKFPWFKFYPSQHLSHPGLRLCSLAAKGLYIDLMALAYDSDQPGLLTVKGRPMTDRDLSRLLGYSLEEIGAALLDLESAKLLRQHGQQYIIPAMEEMLGERSETRARVAAHRAEQSRTRAEQSREE